MGLIRKFTVAAAAALTLGGAGLAYVNGQALSNGPDLQYAAACRDLLKFNQPCSVESQKALIRSYDGALGGVAAPAVAFFAGTTLLALAAKRRLKAAPPTSPK